MLEVGFGGGLLLSRLIARSRSVCGVDLSEQALSAAQSRYKVEVESGRVSFKKGAIEALPYNDASFDRAITANTIYFWNSLSAGFAELHRVLSPGGRLVVGFLPKQSMDRMNMPSDIFTPRAPDEVTAAMRGAGFGDVGIVSPDGAAKWRVAVGTR